MRWRILRTANAARALLAAVVAAACCCSCSAGRGGQRASGIAHVGHLAPDWTQRSTDGSTLSPASLRGKAVYLNFFATWCPPCNQEAPDINALQKQYRARGLQIVGIDELENAEKAREFTRKYGLVYPTIVDDGTIGSQYEVNGLPVHVFIDRAGVVRKIVVGEMSKSDIDGAIRSVL